MNASNWALILPRIAIITTLVLFIVSTTSMPRIMMKDSVLINGKRLFTERNSLSINDITPIAYPISISTEEVPSIKGTNAIVVDIPSRSILYQKSANERRSPASTTKIITALAILSQTNIEEWVKVPSNLYEKISGSMMKLAPGDELSRKDLLWGMLINSGNDAAYTLAQTYPNGEQALLSSMNSIMQSLHLNDSNFTNPVGFDDPNHYTSAFDLAQVTLEALHNPLFQQIVATSHMNIVSPSHPSISYNLTNTNELLTDTPGVLGVKTGWTEEAQGVLVTLINRSGHPILVVVMNSPQREKDSLALLEWVYRTHTW
ncbi:D-alanyl-D-alanine carboxypeptidase [candidate division WWE3 bacterium]|nr:D-alanyl-D-alanine carboxypeptidase [candidate division WWE3 bacterium]